MALDKTWSNPAENQSLGSDYCEQNVFHDEESILQTNVEGWILNMISFSEAITNKTTLQHSLQIEDIIDPYDIKTILQKPLPFCRSY